MRVYVCVRASTRIVTISSRKISNSQLKWLMLRSLLWSLSWSRYPISVKNSPSIRPSIASSFSLNARTHTHAHTQLHVSTRTRAQRSADIFEWGSRRRSTTSALTPAHPGSRWKNEKPQDNTPDRSPGVVLVCVSDVIDFVELAPQTTQCGLLGSDVLKINRGLLREGGVGQDLVENGKNCSLWSTLSLARGKGFLCNEKKN